MDTDSVAHRAINQTEARELLNTLKQFIADHEASGCYCAGLNGAWLRAKNIVFHVTHDVRKVA